jgi:hypothetical protein
VSRELSGALHGLRRNIESGFVTPNDVPDSTWEAIRRQGFAIVSQGADELHDLLDSAHPYITFDVAFHAFVMMAASALDEWERCALRSQVSEFVTEMKRACIGQAGRVRDDEAALARRNAAFFAVAKTLLDGAAETEGLPEELAVRVEDEVAKIRAHAGIHHSSLFAVPEDFSKYKPRGRHGGTEEASTYFQAMMYLGRMLFRAEDETETRQALLLLDVLESEPALHEAWAAIDAPLRAFFGKLDDAGVQEYADCLSRVPTVTSGEGRALAVVRSPRAFEAFRALVARRPGPSIRTPTPTKPNGDLSEAGGFRILGQRYTRPIDVFQQWMEECDRMGQRSLPSGLHVASALLGSEEAERLLVAEGRPPTREFVDPPPAPDDPCESLPETALHCFPPAFERWENGPKFTRSTAWQRRWINSSLGGWSEMLHTTMLYTKDSGMLFGAWFAPTPFRGYVDPYPECFDRLERVVERFVATLEAAGVFAAIERAAAAAAARKLVDDEAPVAATRPILGSSSIAGRSTNAPWSSSKRRSSSILRTPSLLRISAPSRCATATTSGRPKPTRRRSRAAWSIARQ